MTCTWRAVGLQNDVPGAGGSDAELLRIRVLRATALQ